MNPYGSDLHLEEFPEWPRNGKKQIQQTTEIKYYYLLLKIEVAGVRLNTKFDLL